MPRLVMFHGDHGTDFLVVHRILHGEYFPLLGPVLAIDNFYYPPTYYYYLALLMKLFSSETVTMFIFAILNIVSGILYADVLRRYTDTATALVFFLLYMVVFSNVEQGRIMWNSYAGTPFMAAAMWAYCSSIRRSTKWIFVLATALSVVGITMYPTGALLIPVYIYYGYRYLSRRYVQKPHALFISTGFFVFALLIISLPSVYFEFAHDFPTVHAIFASRVMSASSAQFIFTASASSFVQNALSFISGIYYLVIPQYFYNPFITKYFLHITVFIVSSFLLSLRCFESRENRKNLINNGVIFGYIYLIPSMVLYAFFEADIPTYRVAIFSPYVLLFLALTFRQAFTDRRVVIRLLSAISFAILLYINSVANILSATNDLNSSYQRYGHIEKLHAFIENDLQKRKIPLTSVDFRIFTDTPDYVNYEIMPLWYFLVKNNKYQVAMNSVGNDAIRHMKMRNDAEYVYLMCFSQDLITPQDCWKRFIEENPNSEIIQENELLPYYIYFVKRSGDTWGVNY